MINTSIHGVTGIEVMDIKESHDGAEMYYTQALEVGTERNGYIKIDLYADTAEALIPITDANHWRTKAAQESARANEAEELANTEQVRAIKAESELARLRQAIDRIAQGVA